MEAYIHPTAIIDEGASIGQDCKIWHFCHVMGPSTMGEKCSLGQNVFVGVDVVLGNNVKVQNNVSIYSGVQCEDDVFLGPSMVFTNVINPRSTVIRKSEFKSTVVKKGATIGANATILCGNVIGSFAFIAAGAVVTKDVPDFALVMGNPAKQTGWVSRHGCRLDFDRNGSATCGDTGDEYAIEDGIVKLKSAIK